MQLRNIERGRIVFPSYELSNEKRSVIKSSVYVCLCVHVMCVCVKKLAQHVVYVYAMCVCVMYVCG